MGVKRYRTFKGLQKVVRRGLQTGERELTNKCSLRDFNSVQKGYKPGQRDFKSYQGL